MAISKAANGGSAVSVGTSDTVVLAANPSRTAVIFSNDHATGVIYLALGKAATLNSGIRLSPVGGTQILYGYTGSINGISTVAASGCCIAEI